MSDIDAADTLAPFPDDTRLDLAPITLGDLRRARRALAGKATPTDPKTGAPPQTQK